MALHPNGLEAVAVEVHGFLQVQVGRAYGTQRVTFHGASILSGSERTMCKASRAAAVAAGVSDALNM